MYSEHRIQIEMKRIYVFRFILQGQPWPRSKRPTTTEHCALKGFKDTHKKNQFFQKKKVQMNLY